MDIEGHRKAIDQLDEQIVRLLNERTQHVLEIGTLKRRADEEIYAPHREQAVLDRVCHLSHGPIAKDSLRAIYREIMSSALSLEKPMSIAYLGPEDTYTHQAALHRFGASLEYWSQTTIADVFEEVGRGRADYGVVPVENSTEGVVSHTLDMFLDSDLKIISQIVMPVQHCFASLSPAAEVKKLFAHPQTLAQCRRWIQNHLAPAEVIETSSNARSAALAATDKTSAAITGTLAAQRHGLQIWERDIQDSATNATRFLVLGRECSPPTGKDRTSLLLSLPDQVGALYQALASFRRYGLNLTKIESRPSKRRRWEYVFFVDCDGHVGDKQVKRAIEELKQHCDLVKVLGSYPNGE